VTLRPLLALLLLGAAAGCGGDDADPGPAAVPMAPRFAPDSSLAPLAGDPGSSPTTAGDDADAVETATGGDPGAAAASGAPAPDELRASATDARGDATPALADAAPGWADLVGAELRTVPAGFELRVSAAEAFPSQAPQDRTMNVAAFADVDGDGTIDYEVWANLAAEGWGGAWYDNRAGTARFTDESGVEVVAEAGSLVLRFPAGHLGGTTSFRWSVASEWGRYEAIGTVAAARDDLPDGDAPTPFPG
jgi:hypothetical protein